MTEPLSARIIAAYGLPGRLAAVVIAIEKLNRDGLPCHPRTLKHALPNPVPAQSTLARYCSQLKGMGAISGGYGQNISLAEPPAEAPPAAPSIPPQAAPEPHPHSQRKSRRCLKCRESFVSAWAGERTCKRCKNVNAQSYRPDTSYQWESGHRIVRKDWAR